ncbi:MAG: Rnf electron transport complex subunit RnfG [Methanohalobium sp.]|uniref:Rnf electron transport complex subunit RnfG n=1 Tax=Methanohalobium sp. TaxID=2837493 RepID=UPI00397C46B8
MNESNKEIIKVISKLVLISVVASAVLGATYVPTQEQLRLAEQKETQESLTQLIPEVEEFEPVYLGENEEEVLYYEAYDSNGNIIGYGFVTEEPGYEDDIKMAAAVDADLENLIGMNILSQAETPGKGTKIKSSEFKNQFDNLPLDDLALSQDSGEVDAISGSTVSSSAVVTGLNNKVSEIKQEINK